MARYTVGESVAQLPIAFLHKCTFDKLALGLDSHTTLSGIKTQDKQIQVVALPKDAAKTVRLPLRREDCRPHPKRSGQWPCQWWCLALRSPPAPCILCPVCEHGKGYAN
jgi:hypothetical protein